MVHEQEPNKQRPEDFLLEPLIPNTAEETTEAAIPRFDESTDEEDTDQVRTIPKEKENSEFHVISEEVRELLNKLLQGVLENVAINSASVEEGLREVAAAIELITSKEKTKLPPEIRMLKQGLRLLLARNPALINLTESEMIEEYDEFAFLMIAIQKLIKTEDSTGKDRATLQRTISELQAELTYLKETMPQSFPEFHITWSRDELYGRQVALINEIRFQLSSKELHPKDIELWMSLGRLILDNSPLLVNPISGTAKTELNTFKAFFNLLNKGKVKLSKRTMEYKTITQGTIKKVVPETKHGVDVVELPVAMNDQWKLNPDTEAVKTVSEMWQEALATAYVIEPVDQDADLVMPKFKVEKQREAIEKVVYELINSLMKKAEKQDISQEIQQIFDILRIASSEETAGLSLDFGYKTLSNEIATFLTKLGLIMKPIATSTSWVASTAPSRYQFATSDKHLDVARLAFKLYRDILFPTDKVAETHKNGNGHRRGFFRRGNVSN